jgi:hypothetical protein
MSLDIDMCVCILFCVYKVYCKTYLYKLEIGVFKIVDKVIRDKY